MPDAIFFLTKSRRVRGKAPVPGVSLYRQKVCARIGVWVMEMTKQALLSPNNTAHGHPFLTNPRWWELSWFMFGLIFEKRFLRAGIGRFAFFDEGGL
jgi:hypothetical protein